jgi:DNA-binding response OmpR family regulator
MDVIDLTATQPRHADLARKPLLGLTILAVEDSRYACEALRLMAVRSGARLRRADSLKSAYRHLATYRPSVVIVDIGLPDGPGLDLIADLAQMKLNAPAILATSGDGGGEVARAALAAGADAFLEKPVTGLRAFQTAILRLFPDREAGRDRSVLTFAPDIRPDALALREDLRHVLDLVGPVEDPAEREVEAYAIQFLSSVARAAGDADLAGLAAGLAAGGGARAAARTALVRRLETLPAL